jgi:GT2 family glycosyltransferase
MIHNTKKPSNRLLIGTPTLGTVRIEWAMSRYGQLIPCNWSMVQMMSYMNSYAPVGYLVADAQNLIVKNFIENDYEWLLLLEDDNILPPDGFSLLNAYMHDPKVPVVSGLYFTKSDPSEPILYRGRGNSYYDHWKMGDKVWVDGVPTGCLLIHHTVLKTMWNESAEYNINGTVTRRVFEQPEKIWFDPEVNGLRMQGGTSDLEWCTRIMKDKIFEKAGWKTISRKKFPFLVDTKIFVKHIDKTGKIYPNI